MLKRWTKNDVVAILVGGVAPHQDARAGRAYIRGESIGQLRIGPADLADLEILKYVLWLAEENSSI